MKYLSPVKAIKKHCLECSGDNAKERKNCAIKKCQLYPYRLGKNPNKSGIGGRKSLKNPK